MYGWGEQHVVAGNRTTTRAGTAHNTGPTPQQPRRRSPSDPGRRRRTHRRRRDAPRPRPSGARQSHPRPHPLAGRAAAGCRPFPPPVRPGARRSPQPTRREQPPRRSWPPPGPRLPLRIPPTPQCSAPPVNQTASSTRRPTPAADGQDGLVVAAANAAVDRLNNQLQLQQTHRRRPRPGRRDPTALDRPLRAAPPPTSNTRIEDTGATHSRARVGVHGPFRTGPHRGPGRHGGR